MADSFVTADNLLSAGIVLPNPAGNSLLGYSQGRINDKRRKWVRPSSPILEKIQDVVRPQPRFLVMSRVDDNGNLKHVSPFIVERAINGAAKSDVSIWKLHDGTILIQTVTDVQSSNTMAITEIPSSNTAYILVKVEPHGFFNACKGVVTCFDLHCMSIEEICEELSSQHELLSDESNAEKQDNFWARFYTVSMQVALNIVSVVFLAGTGVLMWYLLSESEHNAALADLDTRTWSMLMPLVVTLIMMIAPVFFSWIVR
uniref:Uncharacterized protein n=1 Tax=Timema bartmani TaxID=61472 RepID=A0A7R9I501_9NEOP|nr:unnamed protein product [Timema bartmani]